MMSHEKTLESVTLAAYCHRMSADNYESDMRVRVPESMKAAFQLLAKRKVKKEAELAREAFVELLDKEGINLDDINSALQPHVEGTLSPQLERLARELDQLGIRADVPAQSKPRAENLKARTHAAPKIK